MRAGRSAEFQNESPGSIQRNLKPRHMQFISGESCRGHRRFQASEPAGKSQRRQNLTIKHTEWNGAAKNTVFVWNFADIGKPGRGACQLGHGKSGGCGDHFRGRGRMRI